MLGLVILDPRDALNAFHRVLLDRRLDLRQVRLERLEGEEDRLIQRFIQARAGKGRRFLVPLGDIQLFVQRDQCRGHRVDDAVEVVLEPGEFFSILLRTCTSSSSLRLV